MLLLFSGTFSRLLVVACVCLVGCSPTQSVKRDSMDGDASRNKRTDRSRQCFRDYSEMPIHWRPTEAQTEKFSKKDWSPEETQQSKKAVAAGLSEMIRFQGAQPETVLALWDNSVEAYIDVAYAGAHNQDLWAMAMETAIAHFIALMAPYGSELDSLGSCNEVSSTLTLLVYAHNLHERSPEDRRIKRYREELVALANSAMDDCAYIPSLLGYSAEGVLQQDVAPNDAIYDLLMWSILFVDVLRIDGVRPLEGTDALIADVWAYLGRYPTPHASSFATGANDHTFYDLAYLMTHVGYLPTGYGRHRLYVSDAPWLHEFLRANFYAVMSMGELDLTAEFVDLFRQYGCDERNDVQLRDGSRYLMKLFAAADQKWLEHREPYEEAKISPYDALHKPWTAIAGLRHRVFEEEDEGSYRSSFEKIVEHAGEGDH